MPPCELYYSECRLKWERSTEALGLNGDERLNGKGSIMKVIRCPYNNTNSHAHSICDCHLLAVNHSFSQEDITKKNKNSLEINLKKEDQFTSNSKSPHLFCSSIADNKEITFIPCTFN